MAPQKRKRPHDVPAAESQAPAPAPTRRGTRHNPLPASAAESVSQPEHQLRSGRVRASTAEKDPPAELGHAEERARRNDASKPATVSAATAPARQTRTTRHSAGSETAVLATIDADNKAKRQQKSTRQSTPPRRTAKGLRSPKQQHAPRNSERPVPQVDSSDPSPPEPRQLETHPPSLPPKHRTHPPKHHRQIPKTTAAAAAPSSAATTTPKRPTSDKPPKPPPTPRSDRNIDKVVLGNICFRAWYPSYYGKEVLGDVSGNTGAASSTSTTATSSFSSSTNNAAAGSSGVGAKIGGGKHRDPPMLERLYVCPCCFKYSKELVLWWEHVRCCETRALVPGRKVYTHPKGGSGALKGVRVPVVPGEARGRGKKKVEGGKTGDEEEGEWSVWEVDGEKDVLFCQNLSLFAKLFLDNKSVFFDVTGFNYFLLVYTPPSHHLSPSATSTTNNPDTTQTANTDPSQISSSSPPTTTTVATTTSSSLLASPPSTTNSPSSSSSSSAPSSSAPKRPQIVGFFSKEKMSWDNNNLACILVFPPWQRKGLGALLMGVSYEISRREGILGGPEKPISELGRKGYKRFWAGEIARWLLALEVSEGKGGETLVDVEMCARATWIVLEDCLAVLRDMGVVEEAGVGPKGVGVRGGSVNGTGTNNTPTVITNYTPSSSNAPIPPPLTAAASVAAIPPTTTTTPTPTTTVPMDIDGPTATTATDSEVAPAAVKENALVPRVRIDKEAVRKWVRDNGIELSRTCDPGGFVEGYAVKGSGSGKGVEMEKEEEEGGNGGDE
ncbi:acyl-CoA N-acyltransferase [Biscogniauxia sp. FL1348]|nr:acyl-CoA N-acyltransferase [Biscogniauxia sp. FL1348]